MIPLRASESLTRFPYATLVFIVLLLLIHGGSFFLFEDRASFLAHFAVKRGEAFDFSSLLSLGLFSNTFFMLVNVFFIWALLPKLLKQLSGGGGGVGSAV